MADVHGTCDERFSAVREALARNLDGDELGASAAVDLDEETVVDLWGGYRDEERTTPSGVSLLSPKTIDLVLDQQSDGVDLVLGERFRFGIGFCLGSPLIPYVPDGRTFHWSGWGGSLIVVDLDRGLTISYLMNRMAPGILGSDRAESYVRAVYGAAG